MPVHSLTSHGSEDKPLKIGMSQEVSSPLRRRLPDRWSRRSTDQRLSRSAQPEGFVSALFLFFKRLFLVFLERSDSGRKERASGPWSAHVSLQTLVPHTGREPHATNSDFK